MSIVDDGTEANHSHWTQFLKTPIICIDFHHTVTKWCEVCFPDRKYELQEGAKEAITKLSKEFRIVIFSGNPDGLTFLNQETYKQGIRDFLIESEIPFHQILFTKPPAVFIIDDRAIHHRSWDETADEIESRLIRGMVRGMIATQERLD